MDNRDTNPGALSRQPQRGLSRPIGRYNPLHDMQEQMRRMDALFNRMFGYDPMLSLWRSELQQLPQNQIHEPDVDIFESDTEYIIRAALPGIAPQDIHLEVTEDSVTLSAQRRAPFDNAQQDQANNQNNQMSASGSSGAVHGQQMTQTPGSGQSGGVAPGQTQAASQHMSGSGNGGQANNRANEDANAPHIQHRQSRYSAQTRIRLAYALPGPIDPDSARANFQHGMLELHLPKQRQATARTVPINVDAGATQQSVGAATNFSAGQTSGSGSGDATQEGRPAHKMGSAYTPSAGEDHAAQAQSIGARTDHEPGRQENPIAAGQTNPLGTGANPNAGTPAETQRS
jgi:HSP20 family molecular chaperone IbpA